MLGYLGLDLSLTQTGVVIIDEEKKIKLQGVVKTKKTGDKPSDELERLNQIVQSINKLIDAGGLRINYAAIEGIAFGIQKTTALAQLSALNYFTRNMLTERGIHYVIVAPMTLKKYTTGTGKAGKEMMMLEILHKHGETFHNDNIADAYALARVAHGLSVQEGLTEDQKSTIMNLFKQLPL